MDEREALLRLPLFLEREPVEPVLQDRLHMAVGAGAGRDGPTTGRLQTLPAVLLRQPQDPQARAVPLFGVAALFEDGPH